MQSDGKCGVKHLEPGCSGTASPKRYLLRNSPKIGRNQTWDSQGGTFQAEGTESAEALRWEGGGYAAAWGGKEFRFSADTGEGSEQGMT